MSISHKSGQSRRPDAHNFRPVLRKLDSCSMTELFLRPCRSTLMGRCAPPRPLPVKQVSVLLPRYFIKRFAGGAILPSLKLEPRREFAKLPRWSAISWLVAASRPRRTAVACSCISAASWFRWARQVERRPRCSRSCWRPAPSNLHVDGKTC